MRSEDDDGSTDVAHFGRARLIKCALLYERKEKTRANDGATTARYVPRGAWRGRGGERIGTWIGGSCLCHCPPLGFIIAPSAPEPRRGRCAGGTAVRSLTGARNGGKTKAHPVLFVKSAQIFLRQPSRFFVILPAFPDHSRTGKVSDAACLSRGLRHAPASLLRMNRRDSPPGRAQTGGHARGHGDPTFVTSAP